jgi:hypothetical protein
MTRLVTLKVSEDVIVVISLAIEVLCAAKIELFFFPAGHVLPVLLVAALL